MRPVTFAASRVRKYRSASSYKGMRKDKRKARRVFRHRLKADDKRTDFNGHVAPTYTERDVI